MASAFELLNRRTVRGPVNPLDKTTVVSVYPKEIRQRFDTVDPPEYFVPGGTPENPGLLVVGSGSTWQDIDPDRPLIEVPLSSPVIAEAIVRDSCNTLYGADPGQAPGLFFILGDVKLPTVLKDYKAEIAKAVAKQNNWYNFLIRIADSLWARSNGNPLAISDDMRFAANQLNKMDKDWLKDFQAVEKVRCAACGSFKDPKYPICAFCKYGDADAVKKLGLVAVP